MASILMSIPLHAQLKIGDNLPEIILNNQVNEKVDFSLFKGKIVLIDFWASWCAPCRIANKKLVKMYASFKTHKFEIIAISLDTDTAKWLKAIQKDKLTYTQLIDAKGFDAKSAINFGVEELPSSYLFDAKGKLIAINPTEKQIKNQIGILK
jgi:peroxiredoxin